MNLIIVLLASVKRLSVALIIDYNLCFKVSWKHIYVHNIAYMHIASVTGVDKLLLLVLVVVSAIFNEAL